MVFIKDVSGNADAGTAQKWGGNDINYLDDYFDNVDITPKVARINTATYFRSGKFSWRNPADTFQYNVVAGAITGNRNVTLPVLTADDTFVFKGIDNLFSVAQTMAVGNVIDALFVYRQTSVDNDRVDINFDFNNASAARVTFGDIQVYRVDGTAGSEDGKFTIQLVRAGTKSEQWRLEDGDVVQRSPSSSNDIDYTFRGIDSGAADQDYAVIRTSIADATAASEDATLTFRLVDDGTMSDRLKINDDGSIEILVNTGNATAQWLKRGRNNANDTLDINFQHFNSSSAYVTYATLQDKLITNTAGSEDGELRMFVKRAGAMPTAAPTFFFHRTGTIGLFHNTSTNFDEWGLEFYALDNGSALQQYGDMMCEPQDTVAGTEDAQFDWDLVRAGSIVRVMKLDNTGQLRLGRDTSNMRSVITTAFTSSDDIRFVNSSAENTMWSYTTKGSVTGVDGSWYLELFGYLLQNSVTATDYTLRIKVGGTTVYQDVIGSALAQSATKLPFIIKANFFPSNQSTTTARMVGHVEVNDTGGTVTTGQGDSTDDEQLVNATIRAEGITWTFANDTAILVSMQMSQAQAATEWQMDYGRITFWPS